MDWNEAQTRLAQLRDRHDSADDVASEARELLEAVDRLVDGAREAGPDYALADNPDALAQKAELVRRLLCVGELDLPTGADRRLSGIARRIAPRIIGPAMQKEFNHEMEAYIRAAQEARNRVESCTNRNLFLESRAATLRAYLGLLDALLGSSRQEEVPP